MTENDSVSGCAILVSKSLCGHAYCASWDGRCSLWLHNNNTVLPYQNFDYYFFMVRGLIWIFIVSPKIGWAEIWYNTQHTENFWRPYRICNGEKDPGVVLAEQVAKYREVFQLATQQVGAKVLILPTYFIMHCSLWNLGHSFSPFHILKILDYQHTLNKNYLLETKQPRRLCAWYHFSKFKGYLKHFNFYSANF